MNKPTLKMPGFFDEAYVILTMPRGKQRRTKHAEIIIETLTALGSQKVTKDELQRLARIQRKRFLETFKALLAKGYCSSDSFEVRLVFFGSIFSTIYRRSSFSLSVLEETGDPDSVSAIKIFD